MKFFSICVAAAVVAVGLPAQPRGSLSWEVGDGHLDRWVGEWQNREDFDLRWWGTEAGWSSGSLRLGPVLLGPLTSSWGPSGLWDWRPDPSAPPGSWGAVLDAGPVGGWFVQTPETVGVGAQGRWESPGFSAGLGWQTSWPGGPALRAGLGVRLDVWSLDVKVQGAWPEGKSAQWDGVVQSAVTFPSAGLKLRLDKRHDADPLLRASAQWEGFQANARLQSGVQPWWDADVDYGWQWSFTRWECGLKKSKNDVWDAESKVELGAGAWKSVLQGTLGADWSAAMGLQFDTDAAERWTAEVSWFAPADKEATVPSGKLKAGWTAAGGVLKAELTLLAPALTAQWFGPQNRTTLQVEARF